MLIRVIRDVSVPNQGTKISHLFLTEVIRILVDHAHLIGCVPPCIDEDTRIISSVCDTPLTKKRPKGHRRKHHKRDSISGLLINKFNKWRGRDDATPIKSDDSGTHALCVLY